MDDLKLSNNTMKLFRGYSIEEEYLRKSICSQPLYNANLILGTYSNTKIIIDSLKNQIETNEKEMAFCFSLLIRLDEISKFLEKNQELIKKHIIENELKSFTLDDDNYNLSNKYSVINFDYNELYNGIALKKLLSLKRITVNNIEYLCKKTKEVEYVFNHLKFIFDEDYIEDTSEIVDYFLKTYSKLDVDILDEITENKTNYNDSYEKAKNMYDKYEFMLLGCNDNMYLHYIGKTFSIENYMNYICLYESYMYMNKNINKVDK